MLPHERLDAWKLCNELSHRIDDITDTFPIDEKYRLTSQMRRCALSAPTNIAEGVAKRGNEFQRFLNIALGSLNELGSLLDYARRRECLGAGDWKNLRKLRDRADALKPTTPYKTPFLHAFTFTAHTLSSAVCVTGS